VYDFLNHRFPTKDYDSIHLTIGLGEQNAFTTFQDENRALTIHIECCWMQNNMELLTLINESLTSYKNNDFVNLHMKFPNVFTETEHFVQFLNRLFPDINEKTIYLGLLECGHIMLSTNGLSVVGVLNACSTKIKEWTFLGCDGVFEYSHLHEKYSRLE